MCKTILAYCALSLLASAVRLQAQPSSEAQQPALAIQFPGQSEQPSDSRLAKISGWISREEPSYPPQFVVPAAQRVLDDLGVRNADLLESLLNGNTPAAGARSSVLRGMAGALLGAQHAALRETLAATRVAAVLGDFEPGRQAAPPAELLGKIKTSSQVQHRRLLEGRLDDDELFSLLKKARGDAAPVARKAEPKVLSATEIVSEFSRKNIVGAALDRLQAYSIEATVNPPAGEPREILLFRMRPDRFRLTMQSGGLARQIVARGARGYWVHAPGQAPKQVGVAEVGDLARLGEFLNPFLRQEGSEFSRLEDGKFDGRDVYRIRVTQPEGTRYDSCIDRETFREIGREHSGGSVTRFSDFREVQGITYAFREELTDAKGQKTTVAIKRLRINHGIVPAFFEPPESNDFFNIDRLMAAKDTEGKAKP